MKNFIGLKIDEKTFLKLNEVSLNEKISIFDLIKKSLNHYIASKTDNSLPKESNFFSDKIIAAYEVKKNSSELKSKSFSKQLNMQGFDNKRTVITYK